MALRFDAIQPARSAGPFSLGHGAPVAALGPCLGPVHQVSACIGGPEDDACQRLSHALMIPSNCRENPERLQIGIGRMPRPTLKTKPSSARLEIGRAPSPPPGDLSITQLAVPPLPNLSKWSPDRQIAVFLALWNATADVDVFERSTTAARK